MITIKSKYNIALNDTGLVIQGQPGEPSYVCEQAPTFVNRLAQGDRTYDDFSKWWYMAQTDWFQGFKDDTAWADDGKFYHSTNIDAWTTQGAVQLAKSQYLLNDFTDSSAELYCFHEGIVGGGLKKMVGTDDNTSSKCEVWWSSGGSWTEILASWMSSTNQNVVTQILTRNDIAWILTVGVGTTYRCNTWNGSTLTDQSSYIDNGMSYQGSSCRAAAVVGDAIYVFTDNSTNDYYNCRKTTVNNPTGSGDWSTVFQQSNTDAIPVSACEFGGNLYYLLNVTYGAELWVYNVGAASRTLVRSFKGVGLSNWGGSDKYLLNFNGKLIITLPGNEIWEYDGSSMTRIFYRDPTKWSDFTYNASPYLYYGGVISNNKVWWGNLMYDGERFYNWTKDSSDDYTKAVYVLGVQANDYICYTESTDQTKLYEQAGSYYKGTADKNFIVLNQFDKVAGIDKLAYSVTLIFKKFASSQSIVVKYTTGAYNSSTSWTTLGTASATLDGTSVEQKTLYFTPNTTFKKIWFRIDLAGDTNNTPLLYDFVFAYLPRPFTDKRWRFNIDCGDEIRLLDGSLETKTGRQNKAKLEQAWRTNQIMDYQDIDYAATQLNGSLSNSATSCTVDDTSEFPEVGQLRIDDEIIFYTGKTPTTFTGMTRGQKDTKAVSHSDDAVVHNGYKVIIEDFRAQVPIINNERRLEYVVGLVLREVI